MNEENKIKSIWQKHGGWIVAGVLVLVWIGYQYFKPVPKPGNITPDEVYQKIDERLQQMDQDEKTEDSLQAIERKNFLDSITGLDWKIKNNTIIREKNTIEFINNADIQRKFWYLDSALYNR
jgi:hypothetical protein